MDIFRYADMHNLTHRPLISIHINHTLMNSHLPFIPSIGSLPTRALAGWNLQLTCRQRDGTLRMHTSLGGDLLDLATDFIELKRITAYESNPRLTNHS